MINLNGKIYKKIPTYNAYYISADGEIYSYHRNSFITPQLNPSAVNYPIVFLRKDNKSYCHTVHKLVALTWCTYPNNMTAEELLEANSKRQYVVDHIDNNKLNWHASNLRWCTPLENKNFDNWDRTRMCEKLKGNKNAVGKRKPAEYHRYIYIYNGKEYNVRELAKELKCSKSKITESFRINGGLVKSGELTRKIIK